MNRILVVDDDRTTRHVLSKVLTAAGFTTSVAKDGVEALKMLRGKRFDLLLLDVWMPRMNGLELLSKLRSRNTRPRVVVMTSDDAPETLLKAVREQAFTYVHKPVETPELLRAVRDALKAPDAPPIEVISARPEWVELVVPCTREAVERIQMVMAQLDTDLAPELREHFADIDERDSRRLVAFATRLAPLVQYYGPDDKPAGDWTPSFTGLNGEGTS